MYRNICIFMVAMLVCTASSRCIPSPCPERSLISTISALVELASEPSCGCSKARKDVSYIDVIMPPVAAELPCGLGYLAASAPLVASAYGCGCDACVPVTSAYSCTTLATPQCPELRAFAKPVIL